MAVESSGKILSSYAKIVMYPFWVEFKVIVKIILTHSVILGKGISNTYAFSYDVPYLS